MNATLLDGKAVSASVTDTLKNKLAHIKSSNQRIPKLVVVLIGDDPASQVYTKRKAKVAQEIGMESELLTFPANMPEEELLTLIQTLNEDTTVDGILIQLPLPKHLDSQRILEAVSPQKDVDGFHPYNLGKLLAGDNPTALPCTPSGMIQILNHYNLSIEGKHAVVVGRSTIVGKPIAQLLLQQNATVTTCHSRTTNLSEITQQADILVVAMGRPNAITAHMVKPGAIILDVGINRVDDGRLVGDVDFENVKDVAGYITPVPGGVGPMTIATLMRNTVALYQS